MDKLLEKKKKKTLSNSVLRIDSLSIFECELFWPQQAGNEVDPGSQMSIY